MLRSRPSWRPYVLGTVSQRIVRPRLRAGFTTGVSQRFTKLIVDFDSGRKQKNRRKRMRQMECWEKRSRRHLSIWNGNYHCAIGRLIFHHDNDNDTRTTIINTAVVFVKFLYTQI